MLTGLNLGLVNEGRKPSWCDEHLDAQKSRNLLHSKKEETKEEKSLMKKATQSEEKERIRERKKRIHLFILQKLGQMAGNLAEPPRSLPIISMTSLRRGRRH